ncbi:hypothetical protein LA345_38925 (plasmid) [Burkholderia vietnamiensis]|uniref:Uncharacterized protein n=1 Tax=Burkholderia vietnamiensis (strain G4 / LMG 22486) TaxID=269482 RepID=A4JWE5_BURVG|nr:hypothetical protein Bcep1808_7728 [Burkholderia vietnamiensis G4]MCB4349773.1 hypothetical protein [Burkholderia vietnamiensis]
MSEVTQVHVERETLSVEVNIPGHEARTTTALFSHSKKQLIEREGGRCWISGATAEESGHPLEAHHYPTAKNDGIHDMPFPLWVAKRYGVEGYVFSSTTTIHHFEGDGHE